jgi:hypothetical protein
MLVDAEHVYLSRPTQQRASRRAPKFTNARDIAHLSIRGADPPPDILDFLRCSKHMPAIEAYAA